MSVPFILLIMNCEKYRYKAEQQIWLQHIRIPYFHVIGKEDLKPPYEFKDKILYVKTADDYLSLPHKVIAAYEAIHKEYDYQYIFKTDDDQILTQPAFLDVLIDHLRSHKGIHYGGKVVRVLEDHISMYWQFHPELPQDVVVKKSEYCNGRFYLLSCDAVRALLSKKKKIAKEYFEDYAIGYYLDSFYKYPMFDFENDVFVDQGM